VIPPLRLDERAVVCVKVTITVDGEDSARTLNRDLQLMSGSHLLVGGSENPANITGRIMRNSFYGTIDKVSAVSYASNNPGAMASLRFVS